MNWKEETLNMEMLLCKCKKGDMPIANDFLKKPKDMRMMIMKKSVVIKFDLSNKKNVF